ncbi:peroxiredoxin-like family protein [Flavobacterium sp. JP2137]|uniref:peroxiredoxin-like family protein n=1 Tax=Flavobacterium sp. JP2137 TaxID=3414510 RepID=UPI003D2FF73E
MTNKLPEEILAVFSRCIRDFKAVNLEEKAIQSGMHLPAFSLQNNLGVTVHSDEILSKYDKIVLFFFRGSWCPFCQLELAAVARFIQENHLPQVGIFAISPQLPEHSTLLKREQQLNCELLFDLGNAYAKKLGICLSLPEYATATYENLHIDLRKINGSAESELPIPAVYVVNHNGMISYSHIDSNYMNRINLDQLLSKL